VKTFACRRPSLIAVSKKVVCGCGVTVSKPQSQFRCRARTGHTGIDRAECKTEESITVCVLLELTTDLLSQLHCLVSDCGPANSHSIRVDIAAGRAPVTIGDIPRGARQLLSSA
jgi:hypothetical protein